MKRPTKKDLVRIFEVIERVLYKAKRALDDEKETKKRVDAQIEKMSARESPNQESC